MGHEEKTKMWKDVIGIECNTEKKFCVLQKKVLSFGPNHTVEVWLNSSAEPNVKLFAIKFASFDFKKDFAPFCYYSAPWATDADEDFTFLFMLASPATYSQ